MVRMGAVLIAAAVATAGAAQGDNKNQPPAVKQMQEARFPQPVLVGTLIGWPVFLPGGNYERVGRVGGIFKPSNDDPQLVFRYHGHLVALSFDQVALVGAMVKTIDTDRDDLDKLPVFVPADGAFLPATATVRIGVDRKY